MNTITELSSPNNPGWYWWKVSVSSSPKTLHISEEDIKKNKFKNFGGAWYPFPTFDEIVDQRKTQMELIQKINEKEEMMVQLLTNISSTTFTPKKKIKSFLASLPRKTT